MPLALEAKQTFRVVLESDEDKPEKERPYFEFRFVTCREWREVAAIADAIEAAGTGAQAIDKLFDILRIGLTGWANMIDAAGKEIAFDPEDLDRLLTMSEAHELLVKFRNQDLRDEDKKKLESPSPSDTGSSADSAKD